MSLRLRTFGSVYLTRDGALLTGAAGQRRLLALLTVIVAAGERGISRDKLLALLWSEGEPDKSRHALTQALYHTRKALGADQIFLNGPDLRGNPEVLSSDLADFQGAVDDGRLEDAADQYAGPFLDGFYLNGDPGFDFWVASERDRLARQYADVLSTLAARASEAGDFAGERRWRERLAEHDPLDSAAVARLMTCLTTTGDHAAALQHARNYETRMRAELDLPPDPAVRELVAQIRRARPSPETGLVLEAETIESAPAPTPSETRGTTPSSAPPAKRRRLAIIWMWGGIAVAAGVVLTFVQATASRFANARAVQQPTIMVAPFRVAGADPSTAYLAEGLLDLLTTRIADADTKRVADPARVLAAWKAAGYGGDSALSVDAASRVARELGAGEVVIGAVESTASGVVVHASVVDAAGRRIKAQTDVRGSPDSLISLADRIIAGLILKESGERTASEAQPGSTVSPVALRAYLAGRSAYRRGDYYGAVRAYNRALVEEPTFALAALGLATAADRVNAAEQHDRGLAIAWARQSDLQPADRAHLRAFAGPRYPEPSSAAEVMAAWEHVVRVAPDRAEGWHQLGESFYYDGEAIGIRDGPARAGEAFRRALQLDPSFAPSQRMLTLLLARQGDTTALRAFLARSHVPDSGDATGLFVRWRVAQALHDSRALDRVRRAFDDAPNSALRSIAMASYVDGISIDDGDRAIEILRRRPLSDAEEIDVALARHSRALGIGNYGGALAITNELGAIQPSLHPQLRLRVLDAIYANGDRTAALAAATDLERRVAVSPVTGPDSAVRLADACVLGQWRLALRDAAGTRQALRILRSGGTPPFTVPVGANPRTCAELIDVSLAIAERGAAARDRLAHLDSLMLSGPAVSDAIRYANLVVAQQYLAIGEPTRALAALQRRAYMRGWPRYRATGLQLLLDLAKQVGDTVSVQSAKQRLAAARTPIGIPERTNAFVHRLRAFSRRLVQ